MKGEFRRSTFTKEAHYSSVVTQQGRVQVDADWNEMMDLQVRDGQIYLDVWERNVGAVQNSSISDTAITGGPETGAREAHPEEPILRVIREVGGDRKASSTIGVMLGSVGGGRSLVLPELEITVGGLRWEQVSSFSGTGPQDRVYILKEEDDVTLIEFGDGKNGARPPAGSNIVASYRFGDGRNGHVP
jgi:hypothetical protein